MKIFIWAIDYLAMRGSSKLFDGVLWFYFTGSNKLRRYLMHGREGEGGGGGGGWMLNIYAHMYNIKSYKLQGSVNILKINQHIRLRICCLFNWECVRISFYFATRKVCENTIIWDEVSEYSWKKEKKVQTQLLTLLPTIIIIIIIIRSLQMGSFLSPKALCPKSYQM